MGSGGSHTTPVETRPLQLPAHREPQLPGHREPQLKPIVGRLQRPRRATEPTLARSGRTAAVGGSPAAPNRPASAELNSQLQELEDTFTSLGLSGGSGQFRQLQPADGSSAGQLQQTVGQQVEEQVAGRQRRPSQPFSWQQRPPTQQADQWKYQQQTIDGFDPSKFREVNQDTSYQDDEIQISRTFGGVSSELAVPEYDHQDQQILASIERDFDQLIHL